MARKLQPKGSFTFHTSSIIARAIDEALEEGWVDAHHYTDTPDKTTILNAIDRWMWIKLDEVIDFGDDG